MPTTTTVTPSTSTAPFGSAVTLTSKVSILGLGLIIIPSGTVTFSTTNSTGTHPLGSATLSGCVINPCTATLTTTALGVGANTVTASYGGDVLSAASSGSTNVFMTQPPSAPQNLIVSPGDGKNTLTWSPPANPGSSPVTSYTINRAVGAGSFSYLATVPATPTSYVDNTAANGTTYRYLVAANNAAGASAPSNEASGTPQAVLTVPSAPTLTATSQVASIKLHWTSASDGGSAISKYRLYRRVSGPGPFSLIADNLPTGDYQDTTVIIGASYDYQATAVNGIGESAMSNTATASATPFAGPNSSQVQSCPAGSSCTSSTATATDPQTGNNTDGTIAVESSSGPHTATIAVGGPKLTGCTTDVAVGLSVTFNDTSTDAFKSVTYTLNGPDAQAWYNGNLSVTPDGDLCLGLGTQWFHGQGYPVTWVPADGLWEGRIVQCVNNGLYSLGGGHYSQPCEQETDFFSGPNVVKIEFVVHLPPGDGKISGGH